MKRLLDFPKLLKVAPSVGIQGDDNYLRRSPPLRLETKSRIRLPTLHAQGQHPLAPA
jgi:hypothetical protein